VRPASDHDNGAMLRFNHIGVPTVTRTDREIALPHLKITVCDHRAASSESRGSAMTPTLRRIPISSSLGPHVGVEVDDLQLVLKGKQVIIAQPPCSRRSRGLYRVVGAPWSGCRSTGRSYQGRI
jgi:hypothetical protein